MLLRRLDLFLIYPKWSKNYIILLVDRLQEHILEEKKKTLIQNKQNKKHNYKKQ
jgi:hypothetical protein